MPNPKTPDRPALLAAAVAAVVRGWRVHPLRPGDKRPVFEDWEHHATADPDRVTRWWTAHPTHNVGVACGPSGLVVIDLDQPKPGDTLPEDWRIPGVRCGEDVLAVLADRAGQPLPYDTRLVRTGRGGLHVYCTPSAGVRLRNTSKKLGPWIDTRAHGGYVVAPGSIVNGRQYELLHEAPVAPLPTWLARLLTPAPTPPARPVTVDLGIGRRAAYITAAINDETDRVANAGPGTHNHTLYLAAIALGQLVAGGALDEHTVRAALLDASRQRAATARCECTEREANSTITSGLRAGARRPRQVAA
ncbi:MAG TPA: bifunctional DNA primase/polymerase [Mycobacteriales bacterium]|jgi:Bifunctional DNA primase/polymerase, N-terminal.